jgi:hypothetical protein
MRKSIYGMGRERGLTGQDQDAIKGCLITFVFLTAFSALIGGVIYLDVTAPPKPFRCFVLCDGTIAKGKEVSTSDQHSSIEIDGTRYGCWVRECGCEEKGGQKK